MVFSLFSTNSSLDITNASRNDSVNTLLNQGENVDKSPEEQKTAEVWDRAKPWVLMIAAALLAVAGLAGGAVLIYFGIVTLQPELIALGSALAVSLLGIAILFAKNGYDSFKGTPPPSNREISSSSESQFEFEIMTEEEDLSKENCGDSEGILYSKTEDEPGNSNELQGNSSSSNTGVWNHQPRQDKREEPKPSPSSSTLFLSEGDSKSFSEVPRVASSALDSDDVTFLTPDDLSVM